MTDLTQLTDHELNEHFGKTMVKKWGITLYQGEFPTVDKTLPHYCPNCMDLDRPLRLTEDKVNPDEFVLSCTEHHELCEYKYETRGFRIKHRTSLGEHWQPPVTEAQILQTRILNLQKGIDKARAEVVNKTKALNAMEDNLRTYRKKLNALI